jgi:flagellar biogenesis protein FliO
MLFMSKESIQLTESFLKCLAILIAGLWVIFKFIINRDHSPKIQFELDIIFLGRQDDKILIEVVAKLLNKGKVRHVFDEFNFDIYTLNKEDKL